MEGSTRLYSPRCVHRRVCSRTRDLHRVSEQGGAGKRRVRVTVVSRVRVEHIWHRRSALSRRSMPAESETVDHATRRADSKG